MNRGIARWLPVLAVVLACQPAAPVRAPQGPEFLSAPDSVMSALPFSEAVRAGDFLFVSGQLGNVPGKMELVPGGIGPEATQVLANVKAVLERHGASMDAVVKCTVFLADIKEWPAFNAIYRGAFKGHFPARSAFASNGLALGARVELDCTAYAPPARP